MSKHKMSQPCNGYSSKNASGSSSESDGEFEQLPGHKQNKRRKLRKDVEKVTTTGSSNVTHGQCPNTQCLTGGVDASYGQYPDSHCITESDKKETVSTLLTQSEHKTTDCQQMSEHKTTDCPKMYEQPSNSTGQGDTQASKPLTNMWNVSHDASKEMKEELKNNSNAQNYSERTNDGQNILHFACRKGKLEMAEYIMTEFPELLSESDENGCKPIHETASSGNVELFKKLVLKGADALEETNDGSAILSLACLDGQKDMAEYIMAEYPQLMSLTDNDGHKPVHEAARGGNVDILKLFISKDVNVLETTRDGGNILGMACMDGKKEMAEYILREFPDLLSIPDNYGHTRVHDAASGGNIDIFKMCISNGENALETATNGQHILGLACMNDQKEMAEFISAEYPDLIFQSDKIGMKPIHDAALGNSIDILKMLVSKGADIFDTTDNGKTVLNIACDSGMKEAAEYLATEYPDLLTIPDKDGFKPVHDAIMGGNIDIFKMLIKNGVNVADKVNDGSNIFSLACLQGEREIAEYLMTEYPYMVLEKNNNGNKPVQEAVWKGHVNILKMFMSKSVNVLDTTKDGCSILSVACLNGRKEMVEYILKEFPDLLSQPDNEGSLPVHDAARGGNVDILKILVSKGADILVTENTGVNILSLACLEGKKEMAEYIMTEYHHLLSALDVDGNKPVHDAARGGNVEIFKMLVSKGENVFETTDIGKSVLNVACLHGQKEMAEYILTEYPDLLTLADEDGFNPVHDAAWGGCVDILKFLVTKGANVLDTTSDGKSILSLACRSAQKEMAEYIMAEYPDVLSVQDDDGCKPIHDAAYGGNVEILKMLLS